MERSLAQVYSLPLMTLIQVMALKNLWLPMLISTESHGVSMTFYAHDLGINSRNIQALIPYFIDDQ
jgi:hypothetical protein